ncbi:MAG: GNAT family N-acetyltransferase [Terracidiphilus sp.]
MEQEHRSPMCNELRTERLLLRRWRESDRLPFRQMNADPRVMEFMPELLTAEASDALFDRAQEHFSRHGFGPFAVELIEMNAFLGFIGLFVPEFDAHFTPAVEIGWRLASEHWGKGLAAEGARGALRYGFETLRLEEVVSFTAPANLRSRRVMEKLGMSHNPADDFDHPRLPEGHALRRHVLYRIKR